MNGVRSDLFLIDSKGCPLFLLGTCDVSSLDFQEKFNCKKKQQQLFKHTIAKERVFQMSTVH